MSKQTGQARTRRETAPAGLRRPLPGPALGWLLAGLFFTATAAGQGRVADPAGELRAGPRPEPAADAVPEPEAEALPESVPAPEAALEPTAEPASEPASEPGAQPDAGMVVEPAPGTDPLAGSGYVSPYNQVNEYLDAIDRIENDYGPYATELSDLYLGLGQTLLSAGEYERARDAFYRGVQGVRVNSGPNSPEQTNQLYLIANIESVLGNLATADQVLDNIYFINSSYFGEDSPEMLPVLERMYQWYSMMRPPNSPDADYDDFTRRIELTEEMVRINETVHGIGHPETSEAYRRLGEAQFQVVLHLMNEKIWLSPEAQVAVASSPVHVSGSNWSSFGEHYDNGRRVFKKYLDSLAANESTTPLEYAEALANLADWYLVFEKARKSRNLYEQAHQVLSQSDQYADLAEAYMATPKPVHFMSPQPELPEDLPEALQDRGLDISMTVTSLGVVRDVEVLDSPDGLTKDHLGAIRKWARETPFRPAMKDGEVVTTKNFIWHWALPPQGQAS